MTRFFHLHFSGGRYDERHGVPLSELPALAKVDALVRSVARDLFFDGNTQRQRVSPGFDTVFQPIVTHIVGGGSADCEVEWEPDPNDDSTSYFEAAQTEIVDIIGNLANNREAFPPWVSPESMRCLADCLDLVRDDEFVAISIDEEDAPAVGVRHREIVRAEADRPRPEVRETYHIVGRLHAMTDDPFDAVRLSVWERGRPVLVPIDGALHPRCLQAWERRETTLVRLVGEARRSSERRTLEPASEISIIGGPPIGPRVAQLLTVEDGWLPDIEGKSVGITRRFARELERTIWGLIERVAVDRPYLFLVPEGGIEAMWTADQRRTSLHITTDGMAWGVTVDLADRRVVRLERQPPGEAIDRWLAEFVRGRG